MHIYMYIYMYSHIPIIMSCDQDTCLHWSFCHQACAPETARYHIAVMYMGGFRKGAVIGVI